MYTREQCQKTNAQFCHECFSECCDNTNPIYAELSRLRAELEFREGEAGAYLGRIREIEQEVADLRAENERLRSECDKWKMLTYKAMIKFRHTRVTNDPYGKIPSECTTWYDGCNCIVPYEDYSGEDYQKAKQALGEKP